MAIDKRIINLGIQINEDLTWYGGLDTPLYIEAKGQAFANPTEAGCDITVLGLRKEIRDFILQNTKPLNPNRTRISVILEVGRESYGTSIRYQGDVFRSEMIGKPDTGLTLLCRTGYYAKSKLVSRSASEITKLSSIAKWVADDCGYGLSFEIADRNIRSYSFTGSAQSQLQQLEEIANAEVYVNGGTMYVKEPGKAAKGIAVRFVDNNSGLLSALPTEAGVKIAMLYDPVTTIGTRIELITGLNPSINGGYTVYKAEYHVANRTDPFYLTVDCTPAND